MRYYRQKHKVKVKKNQYHVASGTKTRILTKGDENQEIKFHITRRDLTFEETDEVEAPHGWRAFERSNSLNTTIYIIQIPVEHVLYDELWSLF